jgi:hypothetical protein
MPYRDLHKAEKEKAVQYASEVLHRIAPPGDYATEHDRIRVAADMVGLPFSRTKDLWYKHPKANLTFAQGKQIEIRTGIPYEDRDISTTIENVARRLDDLVQQAARLLQGADPEFHDLFIAGFKNFRDQAVRH